MISILLLALSVAIIGSVLVSAVLIACTPATKAQAIKFALSISFTTSFIFILMGAFILW